jgi:uncharacterized membrane protein
MGLTLTYMVTKVPNFAHATLAITGSAVTLLLIDRIYHVFYLEGGASSLEKTPYYTLYLIAPISAFLIVGLVALIPYLLGVKAVIAESYERIHRSNLVCMGILPLEFMEGENAEKLGLDGSEEYDIIGIEEGLYPGKILTVRARKPDGRIVEFKVKTRLDTPVEVEYYKHGGIMKYVLRKILRKNLKTTP